MTQQQAREWGKKTAGEWLFKGTISGRSAARQGNGDLSALFRFCRELQRQEQTGSAANWLLDQLWLLRRESEQAVEGVRRAGRLPAVPYQGSCARVQRLGEVLAESEISTKEALLACLEGVQEVSPFSEEELSILLPCLTLGILRRIRSLTEGWQDNEETAAALKDCFERLRLYSGGDWARELEALSVIHQAFLRDEIYGQMDQRGRSIYRRKCAKLAGKNGLSQKEQAQLLVEQAKEAGNHIGFVLFPGKRHIGAWYPALVMGLSALLSLLPAWGMGRWWTFLLVLLPVSELVKQAVDCISLHMVPCRAVFRLELKDGIPEEGKTLCVISALLSNDQSAKDLCEKLERYYLSNRFAGENVSFGLLADLPDSRTEPTKGEKQRIARAKQHIEQLNSQYNERFFLFIREPAYVPSDDLYRGWERKRGALMELIGLLRGAPTGVHIAAGEVERLTGTAFLLTLDSDTAPAADAIRVLAGTMLHPLNRPVIDEKKRIVVEGCGLLQPRVVTNLRDANATTFAALFCGPAGSDPYTAGAAELYHDLFDRASYCGKGMMDVEAAARCLTGRFPENRILSHDLLEGAFLHARACPEAEVSDGFPSSVEGYFKRQHRWVRGDWQAGRWMCKTVPNQAGKRVKNPLSPIDRWKLLDNLRRSLLPQGLTICLAAAALAPGKALCCGAWLALLALSAPLLLSGAELSLRRFHGCGQRTFFPTCDGFSGAVFRVCVQFLLLPAQAWVNGSAMAAALWRLLVSHRGLLEWTVSGQERAQKRFWVPNVAAGVLLLLLSPATMGKVLGALWLIAPLALEKLSGKQAAKPPLDQRERSFLLHQAGQIWRYFDTWLRGEDHWLPPDNVQERPSVGAARRTSPTNIGLALLSCLAAADLELTSRERAVELIAHQLDTLEGLEKWQGHLYNWYDTETAQPLFPRYISTVDSGNLCGALIALETGLRELEEPALAEKARNLAENMRFRPLYDPERELFYIGWDAEQNEFTDSCYDLLASEARQTSYLAVARGEVPLRHWQRLSRVMSSQRRRFGLASWSGTMFEYFMPHLLLPAEERSLLSESLRLCAWVQKGWGERLGLPWGVSESAFYQLDQGQNYQYKAHGVPPLGLRRGLEQERVVAPYASFLALSAQPHSAVKNLRKLSALGAEGQFGLYEAVDFTPSRTGGQAAIVRSWMVHHLGMSLLSIDNALNGSIMQRRFMAQAEMNAHRLLLEERMPLGQVPPKTLHFQMKRSKMDKIRAYERTGQGFDPSAPACHVLSAGDLLLPIKADGGGTLQKEALLLTEEEKLSFISGNQRWRLSPAGASGQELRWRFRGNQAEATLKRGENMTLHRRCTLDETGLVQAVSLETAEPGTLELVITPILDQSADYEAHRAFSRLGLGTKSLPGGVCVTRRPRVGNNVPALVLLWEGNAALTVTEDCILRLKVPVTAGKTELKWALTAGDEESAYHGAQGLLMGMTAGAADGFSALCGRYKLSDAERRQLDELTSHLLFSGGGKGTPRGQPSLWPFAISGDVPIWTVPGAQAQTGERCIRQWAVLQGCGLSFDLVLLCQPNEREGLQKVCEKLSLSHRIGTKGGVHLVEATPAAAETITGMAAFVGLPGEPENRLDLPPEPPEPLPSGGLATWRWEENDFVIETNGGLLPRRWSHILTNGAFGWTADDCGTGHLWSGNAHENKLTPWKNDPYARFGPERLFLVENGRKTALFAGQDGINTVIRYGAGFARWKKSWEGRSVTLTAFVPPEGKQRIFLVETAGVSGGAALLWQAELQMGPRHRDSRYVTIREVQGRIVAENTANTDFPGERLTFAANVPLKAETAQNPHTMAAGLPASQELVLCAGIGEQLTVSVDEARSLLEQTKQFWQQQAGFLTVDTPEPGLNHYLSFWGRYQTIACRLMARTALYQCGGAYGFRDQLQDVCGLLPNHRALVREQILRCCQHQYLQGDVQHWWHPLGTGDRGVRTRISDDLLWLPWAVCRWVRVTGDRTLLEEPVGWLTSKPLQKGEHNRYEPSEPAGETGTVLEHCVRAIECCLGRGAGAHGLLLMGTGDWNDGMDALGAKGKGESVWLTWFASLVLGAFAPLCEPERRGRYEALSKRLSEQAEQAWDGGWYRRAYDDEGHPVGSRESRDCQMDSVAQSFSVFAPNPNQEHAKAAVQAAVQRLYDPKSSTVALLTPPFAAGTGAGYISAYPEGVRENGGQYTHAAVWLAMAALRLEDAEQGWGLLRALLPETLDNSIYQGEPYVLAGDVSTAPGKEGRAGWTWYTGAASWYCRTAEEELLGLRVRDNRLFVAPRLPEHWPGYDARWRLEGAELHICVRRGETPTLTVNGAATDQGLDLSRLSGKVEVRVIV